MKRAAGPGIAITRFAASASKLPWVRCNSPTGAIRLSFRVGETAAFVSWRFVSVLRQVTIEEFRQQNLVEDRLERAHAAGDDDGPVT